MICDLDQDKTPLLYDIVQSSNWKGKDAFPTSAWHDEYEKYLEFLIKTKGKAQYWDRIRKAKIQQRDDAFAEIQSAYVICEKWKLSLVEWQPQRLNCDVDFVVADSSHKKINVQVKRPSWKANFVKEMGEKAERLQKSKYIHGECRDIDNTDDIKNALEKADKQLPIGEVNYVMICDDLWDSPGEDGEYEALFLGQSPKISLNSYPKITAVVGLFVPRPQGYHLCGPFH